MGVHNFVFFCLILINSQNIWASPLEDYFSLLTDYQKKLCSPGVEQKFDDLAKNNDSFGRYLPLISDEKIDLPAIKENLPLLHKKLEFLKQIYHKGVARKYKRNYLSDLKQVKEILDELVEIKNRHHFTKSAEKKQKLVTDSNHLFQKMRASWKSLIEKIPYFTMVSFPINHAHNRKLYEELLGVENKQHRRNSIFFKRKVLEDGLLRESGFNDKSYRGLLSAMDVNVRHAEGILEEDFRHDLNDLIRFIRSNRFQTEGSYWRDWKKWIEKTDADIEFYEKLIRGEVNQKDYLAKKNEARFQLINFHHEKVRDLMKFWQGRDDEMQFLFAIDLILYNEVGALKDVDLERRDVVRVVINRHKDPEFSQFSTDDPLFKEATMKEKINKWLVVLLKKGEFSFTYYYFKAAKNMYCLPNSYPDRKLRTENLKLALAVKKTKFPHFTALRYFSRESMFARIDMTPIWSDYVKIEEGRGELIKNKAKVQKLKKLHQKGKYDYLYSFLEGKKEECHVFHFKKEKAVRCDDGHYYDYRNIHLFKYFRRRNI